ncbi:unnamed protein product [Symbiodinium natans]|uniref:Uncharacterized protein n=1 Tax=Symbiodinium natans TaxID=878477 RepID=A0A812H6Q7_9DINO|nr:unnamed protein product [Symbiodinium natans]
MSLRAALTRGSHELVCGITANVSGCFDFWTNRREAERRYTTSNLKTLLISVVVTSLVCWLVLIPIHLLFYIARLIIYFAKPQWNQPAASVHSNITFYNLLFDACWYLPLIILFLARNLSLFSSKPFFSHLDQFPNLRDGLSSLPVQSDRYMMWLRASLKSIGKLVLLSVVVFLLKMGFRRLQHGLSVFTVFYTQYSKYYKKVRVFADPKYGKQPGLAGEAKPRAGLWNRGNLLMLIGNLMVAYLMFDNVGVATLFLRFYEWYIASVALSTELLGEYTYRLTYQQERIFVYRHGWFLCGFGTVVLAAFYVPFLGLVLYHTFQYASVKLLVTMLEHDKSAGEEPRMILWDRL